MTLNTNEIVYTADLMNISPANDAQIYGKDGNYILSGLEIRDVTPTSAILTAGRALIQGRLFELKANTQYTLTAGTSQYLGLEIDLTKNNIDDGMGNITNNQFTVKSNDREYGDTLLGDIQSFVAFYQVNTQTQTSTQLVFPYRFTQDLTYGYGDVAFPADTRSVRPMVRRIGKDVQVQGVLNNKYTVNNGQSNLVMRTLPAGCRPMGRLFGTTPSAGGVYEVDIDTNGNILLTNFTGRAIKPGSFISITFSFMAA